jgi:hypothetical protein
MSYLNAGKLSSTSKHYTDAVLASTKSSSEMCGGEVYENNLRVCIR